MIPKVVVFLVALAAVEAGSIFGKWGGGSRSGGSSSGEGLNEMAKLAELIKVAKIVELCDNPTSVADITKRADGALLEVFCQALASLETSDTGMSPKSGEDSEGSATGSSESGEVKVESAIEMGERNIVKSEESGIESLESGDVSVESASKMGEKSGESGDVKVGNAIEKSGESSISSQSSEDISEESAGDGVNSVEEVEDLVARMLRGRERSGMKGGMRGGKGGMGGGMRGGMGGGMRGGKGGMRGGMRGGKGGMGGGMRGGMGGMRGGKDGMRGGMRGGKGGMGGGMGGGKDGMRGGMRGGKSDMGGMRPEGPLSDEDKKKMGMEILMQLGKMCMRLKSLGPEEHSLDEMDAALEGSGTTGIENSFMKVFHSLVKTCYALKDLAEHAESMKPEPESY